MAAKIAASWHEQQLRFPADYCSQARSRWNQTKIISPLESLLRKGARISGPQAHSAMVCDSRRFDSVG
jgi:hypothetical protein